MSDKVTIPGSATTGVVKRIVPSSRTSAVTEPSWPNLTVISFVTDTPVDFVA